jgi:carbon monoxide dehydrogenase subunit G
MVSLEFLTDIIHLAALWPGVDAVSNRNEYQEYFLGVKAASAFG